MRNSPWGQVLANMGELRIALVLANEMARLALR
jgi:hypothetical protein